MNRSNSYQLQIEREGVNQVHVFKKNHEDSYENYWNFSLFGDDEPIILSEFYNENQFVVINWNGWIRLFDAKKKILLLDYDLKGNIDAKAVFSVNQKQVYICIHDHNHKAFLVTLDLITTKIAIQELGNCYASHLGIRKDGCLLFYKQDWDYENKQKKYTHGFTVFNPKTSEQQYFSLPEAPCSSFDSVKPFIDTRTNVAIMPYYGAVQVKNKEKKQLLFEYHIMLIRLNTFEVELLPVRDFEKYQLSCFESSCEEMAELFLNKEVEEEEYQNAVCEFCEDLNTVYFVEDGFWLCWRNGVLRKVYNDKSLSALLITHSLASNSGKGMFQFPFFHSQLYRIEDNNLYLFDETNYYSTVIPDTISLKNEVCFPISLEITTLDTIHKTSYTNEKKKEIDSLNKIILLVENIALENALLDALHQMYLKITSLETLGLGTKLEFQIEDTQGTIVSEPSFFEKVANLETATTIIQNLIEKFCDYPKAKYLYRNEQETALCYAVLVLSKKGKEFLPTVLRYLATIDLDHDVFTIEHVIPYLDATYERAFVMENLKIISEDCLEWFEFYWQEMDADKI
ncbi:MAG: hypothetical protein CMP76_00815 [Flavobacterium sp.]|uniref:hypothetical protein n=1 Tax=Flavobacterium sp. TaxID=239 RepID=UPI000C4C496F|nr:hypothetical protein [Flavobacterium sp.]MBF01816.1 hypothetical protein [Flavobacterium sp.]